VQDLEQNWSEPLHEYTQFAAIIKKLLSYPAGRTGIARSSAAAASWSESSQTQAEAAWDGTVERLELYLAWNDGRGS
jgi:hypothetical protein